MLFGIIWTLFSSIFVVVGLWILWDSAKQQTWDEVPCELVRFEIRDVQNSDTPFKPDLEFRYEYDGLTRSSNRLWVDLEKGEDDYADLAEIRDEILKLSNQGKLTCRINLDDPNEAVLRPDVDGLWGGAVFAIFGGFFVLIGLAIIFGTARKSKSAKTSVKNSSKVGCGFFGIFALVGLGVLGGLIIPKTYEYLAMQQWEPTPAKVIWTKLKSHRSDNGTTYSVDVFYRYEYEGQEYKSNRRGILSSSSSGRKSKNEFIRKNPPGTEITCYVNPNQPREAVIERELGWWALFALFPVPFLAVGFGGLWSTYRKRRAEEENAQTFPDMAQMSSAAQPVKLSSGGSGVGKRVLNVFFAILFAAFWNGIISIFIFKGWGEMGSGVMKWFITIFMIPFVLVGIGLIIHIFYRIFAIFSPIYQVEIADRYLSPGGHTTLTWKRTGGGGKPRKFAIWLIGREEATYRRGTSTSTARACFHEEVLFETESSMMMPRGRVTIDLPPDSVPSFRSRNNKVRWFVMLVADVPFRPDIKDEYEIDVNPTGEGPR